MTESRMPALRAMAHPVRLQILSLLTGAEMSAAELARELGLTHANASYHLRVLAAVGEVEEAGEEKVRGGVAKKYRHPWERVRSGEHDSAQDRQLWIRAVADEMVRRFARRRTDARRSLTDAEMWLTPEAWAKVVDLVEQASELVHAEARPPHTEGTVHVNLTAAAFEMGEHPAQESGGPADGGVRR